MCTGDGHMHARAGPSSRGRARAARLGPLSLQIGAGICTYAQARPERVQRGSAPKLANRRRHMHARAGPSSRGRAHTARLGPLSLHICCVLNIRAGLSGSGPYVCTSCCAPCVGAEHALARGRAARSTRHADRHADRHALENLDVQARAPCQAAPVGFHGGYDYSAAPRQ